MMQEKTLILDMLRNGEDLADLIAVGSTVPIRVTGSSMRPFLKEGRDTVLLKAGEPIRRGSILFFRRTDGRFVLHRARRILRGGNILVNGDAQSWCETIAPGQVLAVVTAFSRNGRQISARSLRIRLRDLLWYPTRPIRPTLFRTYRLVRRLFRR